MEGRSNVIVLRDMLSDDDPLLRNALRDVTSVPAAPSDREGRAGSRPCRTASLPEHYREIVLLREFEDMSYQEIADVAQLPIGTVMSRLSRARRALREALIESGEGDERSKL